MEDLKKAIGTEFFSHSGSVSFDEAFKAKIVCLYFSAHWCPPCRNFTPKLADLYKKWNENEKNVEVIFCSADHDEKSFKEYFDLMPWLSIPFNSDLRESAPEDYAVSGIPTLIVFNPKTGKIIEGSGKSSVDSKKEEALGYWISKLE